MSPFETKWISNRIKLKHSTATSGPQRTLLRVDIFMSVDLIILTQQARQVLGRSGMTHQAVLVKQLKQFAAELE